MSDSSSAAGSAASSDPDPAAPSASDRATSALASDPRVTRLRIIAIVSGLVGTLCFLALPFLPVAQTSSSVQWPQNGSVESVTAPLMAHTPQEVTATIPCTLVADLPEDGGILLSTAPAGGEEGAAH